jgi:hypothetical protein
MKKFFVVLLLQSIVLCSYGNPSKNTVDTVNDINLIPTSSKTYFEEAFMVKLNSKCLQKDNSSCLMSKMITYMNRLLKKSKISINDNLEVTQNREIEVVIDKEDEEVLARSSSTDQDVLSVLAAEKIWRFLNSRSLKWKMLDDADFVMSNDNGRLNVGFDFNARKAFDEARGKMKHSAGPAIMAAIAAKVGILAVLAFKGLLALVGKAFFLSKIALLFALALGLKKLLTKKKIVTYEVVAHNTHGHDAHHHDSYSSGWGRAMDGFMETFAKTATDYIDAHSLAYKQPQQN